MGSGVAVGSGVGSGVAVGSGVGVGRELMISKAKGDRLAVWNETELSAMR